MSRSVESPAQEPSAIDLLQRELEAEESDARRFRRTVVAAVVFHVILLFVTFPELARKPLPAAPTRNVYAVQTVRFQPPKPPSQQQIPPKKAKKIPIPDPTPEEPEPIEIAEQPLPDLDTELLEAIEGSVFGIPDAPPGPVGPAPMHVTGNVVPPKKLVAPQPRYTEEARQARLQGVVVLQAVIDAVGDVREVEVLKGLGLGLTESAVETVGQWKFEPATLEGEPVPVYLSLVVNFSLQ